MLFFCSWWRIYVGVDLVSWSIGKADWLMSCVYNAVGYSPFYYWVLYSCSAQQDTVGDREDILGQHTNHKLMPLWVQWYLPLAVKFSWSPLEGFTFLMFLWNLQPPTYLLSLASFSWQSIGKSPQKISLRQARPSSSGRYQKQCVRHIRLPQPWFVIERRRRREEARGGCDGAQGRAKGRERPRHWTKKT